ncbi:MAG: hypothetical protein KDC07_06630 [Chitinophagaceae bacterium]|nr:hypothetical protein [Chitinophagaceae bacterium]MCB9047202.1 hypothetical protein [Chitinophagales bacterium]
MRKAVLFITAILVLTACGKEKKHCWGCVLVFSDGYVVSYRDSMICDKTQSEINTMKKQVYDASAMGFETYQVNKCSKIR